MYLSIATLLDGSQVQDLRGSVFYPLLGSRDKISVQILWKTLTSHPSVYNISVTCVNRDGELKYVSVSDTNEDSYR